MKIRYFDFGLHKGVELHDMQKFLPTITNDFECYGFEAAPTHYNNFCKRYINKNTNIYQVAVTDKHNSSVNLYFAPNRVGHTIHSTKNNVLKDKYWSVPTIKFSEWLKDNNIKLEDSFNIVKINIEGAEWEFFNDVVDSNINKHINIYCGASHDVEKIKKFVDEGIVEKYYKLLEDNNINVNRWCLTWKLELNADIHNLIKNKYKEYY
jgi:FkbM family methyltransferase